MDPKPTSADGTARRAPRIPHIAGLDGLRGAAVLAVLLFHGSHLQGGFLGVDLFFVLSGYLITSLLLAEGGSSGHVGLARFWERRARRLLPALGVMLIGVAAYARFAAKPEELHRIRFDGLATLFYVANWRDILAKSDYFSLFAAPSPLAHTWSLAIEEQFYVVWPLVFVGLLALVRRRPLGQAPRQLASYALALSIGLGLLSGAASLLLTHFDGWNRAYYGTDTRAFAILAGAAVASFQARSGPVREGWPRRVLEIVGVAGVLILGVSWFTLGFNSPATRRGGLLVCSMAGALVVAAVSHPTRGPVSRAASFAPLRWLGLISYGVYLYHWPIFVWLTEDRVHVGGWTLFMVQCLATGVAAVVSYYVVEQPIRHGSGWPRLSNRLVPAAGFAAIGVLLVASTTTAKLQLLPTTTDANKAAAVARANGGPRIMVVGNSIAWYLVKDGFSSVHSSPPLTVLSKAIPGCSYPGTGRFRQFDGTITKQFAVDCTNDWYRSAKTFKPEYVMFLSAGQSAAALDHDGTFLEPCSPEFESWTTGLFSRDAAMFSKLGAKLVLVTSTPSGLVVPQRSAREAYLRGLNCGNDVLRSVAKTHRDSVQLIDLEAHLCDASGLCERAEDGVTLRPDGMHFRDAGAPIVTRWLLDQLGIHTTVR